MDAILLTVHILAASVWIGGGIYASVSYPRHAANGTLRGVVAVDQKLGSIVFGTAIALLLLSGVGLVLMSDTFGFGHAFVLVGIGVIVVSSILEGTLFGPATKKMLETEGATQLPSVVKWALPVYIVMFAFTVWAMVTKLGV
jgi:hypothetical protein